VRIRPVLPRPNTRGRRPLLVTAAAGTTTCTLVVLLVVLAAAVVAPPPPAVATVTKQLGFEATVLGHEGWYGSYDMADLGTGWCIDHGIAAPDPDLGYVPDAVVDVDQATQTAMAWAAGRVGAPDDAVESAALMLVLHDLRDAAYPGGELDVDTVAIGDLVGFGGDEQAVIDRAGLIKADALAHAHLEAPYIAWVEAEPADPGQPSEVSVHVTDGNGAPVVGLPMHVTLTGTDEESPVESWSPTTDANGTFRSAFTVLEGDNLLTMTADAPDLILQAYGPTDAPAQRVALGSRVSLQVHTSFVATPPPGHFVLHKHGDAEPLVPVTGARFRVIDGEGVVMGELVVAEDGTATPLELPPGHYVVEEIEPAPGYGLAGPWEIDIVSGQETVLDVLDLALPGRLTIDKVDAETGQPLAGAVLVLSSGGVEVAELVTTDEPAVVDGLVPGVYQVSEVRAPDGWLVTDTVEVTVLPGDNHVRLVDRRAPAPPETTTTAPAPTTTSARPRGHGRLAQTGGDRTNLVVVGSALVLAGATTSRLARSWASASGRRAARRHPTGGASSSRSGSAPPTPSS
jgi:hypothetical protein